MAQPPCEHFDSNSLKTANEYVCEECVKTGDSWVHLRTCQTCGKTHCCDSSPNKHATKHFHASHHPVVISAEPGEKWAWCYQDEQFMRYGKVD
ncbi:MAG: UBP-type zinc finger domain-containing protein [Bacteroidota bacterium]